MKDLEELKKRIGDNIEQLAQIADKSSHLAQESLRTLKHARQLVFTNAKDWRTHEDQLNKDKTSVEEEINKLDEVQHDKRFIAKAALMLSLNQNNDSRLDEMITTRKKNLTQVNEKCFGNVITALEHYNEAIQAAFKYLNDKGDDKKETDKHQQRIVTLHGEANAFTVFLTQANDLKMRNEKKINSDLTKKAFLNAIKAVKTEASANSTEHDSPEATLTTPLLASASTSTTFKPSPASPRAQTSVERQTCCGCIPWRRR